MSYTKSCPNCVSGIIHRRGSHQCRSCFLKEKSPWSSEKEKLEHHKQRKSEWFQINKQVIYKRRKKHKLNNPTLWKDREYKYHLKKHYGMRFDEYTKLLLEQKYQCLICGNSSERLHVDHDHITKKVRGLLCFNCNGGLGQFKDNLTNLKKAVQYIESYETSNDTKNPFDSAASK